MRKLLLIPILLLTTNVYAMTQDEMVCYNIAVNIDRLSYSEAMAKCFKDYKPSNNSNYDMARDKLTLVNRCVESFRSSLTAHDFNQQSWTLRKWCGCYVDETKLKGNSDIQAQNACNNKRY